LWGYYGLEKTTQTSLYFLGFPWFTARLPAFYDDPELSCTEIQEPTLDWCLPWGQLRNKCRKAALDVTQPGPDHIEVFVFFRASLGKILKVTISTPQN